MFRPFTKREFRKLAKNDVYEKEDMLATIMNIKYNHNENCKELFDVEDKSIRDILDYTSKLLDYLEYLVTGGIKTLNWECLRMVARNLDMAILITKGRFIDNKIKSGVEIRDIRKLLTVAYYYFSGVYVSANMNRSLSIDNITSELDWIMPIWDDNDDDEEEAAE